MEKEKVSLPIKTVSKRRFQQRFPIFQTIIITVFAAFTILTFFAKTNPYFPFDLVITRTIQGINFPYFDQLMKTITYLGNQPIWYLSVIFAVGLAFFLKEYMEGLLILISSFGSLFLSLVLKEFVSRPRPDPKLIIQIGKYLKPDSFPSGHVLFFMGFYGILLFLVFTKLKRGLLRTAVITILSLFLILIGMSRIYLGAHWFSDTLGSYLIGIVWLYLLAFIYRKIKVSK